MRIGRANTASPTPQVASPLTGATSGCWHALGRRPWRAPGRGHAAGPERVVLLRRRARPLRDLQARALPRLRRTATGCRGSSRTISERFSGCGWLGGRPRAVPLWRAQGGAAGGFLTQGPRVLSELWRTAHGRARRASRPPRSLPHGPVRQPGSRVSRHRVRRSGWRGVTTCVGQCSAS